MRVALTALQPRDCNTPCLNCCLMPPSPCERRQRSPSLTCCHLTPSPGAACFGGHRWTGQRQSGTRRPTAMQRLPEKERATAEEVKCENAAGDSATLHPLLKGAVNTMAAMRFCSRHLKCDT